MRSNGLYDFLAIVESRDRNNKKVFTPTFVINPHTEDLGIRGRKFYYLVDYITNLCITDMNLAMEKIDQNVLEYVTAKVGKEIMENPEYAPVIKRLVDTSNGLSKKFRTFCEVDMEDRYHTLNQVFRWSNSDYKRSDYISYLFPYPLIECPTPYYNKIFDTLYLPEQRQKIEWIVGAALCGDIKKVQKFVVLYGEPGLGKSTIIYIIRKIILCEDEGSPFISKCTAQLLVNNSDFGTDFLMNDPIFAYDDEADLSKIDSKSTLNLIVSHERVRVNGKFARVYWTNPNCLLVFASNEPVQVSPRSGIARRLLDVRPTGELLPPDEYDDCIQHLPFERSGIAWHCIQVFKKLGKNYYNNYIPEDMMSRTDPMHNFVKDKFFALKDGTTLANAYSLYEEYAKANNFKTVMVRYKFRDTLKLYYENYENATFSGFKLERIGIKPAEKDSELKDGWLSFNSDKSNFDEVMKDQPAQYAKEDETPKKKWESVTTKLGDLDTRRLHYVLVPKEHIVIDFDLKDENGNKSFEKNLEAASKFPPTYAELSKSGAGIHLHYIYTGGNPDDLSRVYADNIEVKVFAGNASLRRKLSKCNDIPIAEISSGLPLKGGPEKMVDWDGYKNEKILRTMIIKNLNKEYHPATKPSIDYINHLLNEAYRSGAEYDVRDLEQAVFAFALQSTHKADYCVDVVSKMHFCSDNFVEENQTSEEYDNAPIIILDIESYPEDEDGPAFLGVAWKFRGKDKSVVKMYNPSPKEVESLFKYRIVGHNVRGYDAHILYARSQGYTVAECNKLSQRIIAGDKNAKFREAYHIPYADTLDFAAADNKMGLKKWEYKLKKLYPDIAHKEMNLPWDKSVPKERIEDVMNYCANDVISTEYLFDYLKQDFIAKEMLADLSGLTVIDTTNQCTTALLVGDIKDPQQYYIYTDLSKIFPGYEFSEYGIDKSRYKEGVKIVSGKSIYKGIDPGEGGRKIGYPGMYTNVGLFDVASMHPSSMIKLNIFGDKITKRLENLVKARIAIKHGDYDTAIELLGDKVKKYLTGSEEELKKNAKALANALKTAINSVYGLTSAAFDNKLRDPRNKDNIVAKYGALFMINLEEEVTKRGYKVVHVSTDSIKIANVDDKIAEFVMGYGKQYGFTFEYEALYSKMCLVNDAVYIAKVAKEDDKEVDPYWTATGKQFAVPYVFKTLFSHEEIIFDDMCETFQVKEGAIFLDYNEDLPEGEHSYQFVGNVGQFTPIISGEGAATLNRIKNDKAYAVQGTKGYRWLESENVKILKKEDKVDREYYRKLVDDAVKVISEFGDFEWFVSNDPLEGYMNKPITDSQEEEVPFT